MFPLLDVVIKILVFVVILSILVIIHELGHFLVAKKLGIKVEEFGFGFPPKVWGKKIGETIYTLNLLPIGGFVKLFGEDDAGGGQIKLQVKSEKLKTEDEKRAFFARPVWQRAAVVVAGVVMNVLLAAVIYYAFLGLSGFKTELPLLSDHHFFGVNQAKKSDVVISAVVKDSPAEKAGITQGVRIISINGKTFRDLQGYAKEISANKGKQITIKLQDLSSMKESTVKVTPRVNAPKNQGALGIAFFALDTVTLSYDTPTQKIFSGFTHPTNMMLYQFDVLGKLINISVKEKNAAPLNDAVSGPVGIAKVVGQTLDITDLKQRFLTLLNIAGLLSASLAFFNVLPIPALDGGRLFFILFEGITRRKVSPRIEGYIHQVGFILLMGLIILVTFKDIGSLFK